MAYKTFGDFHLTEGSVLVERVEQEKADAYYNIIGIFPADFEDGLKFAYITGFLMENEVDDYIDDGLIEYVGLESINDYEDKYQKIYDVMSVNGLQVFYDPSPFIDYEELLSELKAIDIEGVEGEDYSLALLDWNRKEKDGNDFSVLFLCKKLDNVISMWYYIPRLKVNILKGY